MIDINNKTKSRVNIHLVRRTAEEFIEYFCPEKKSVSIAFVGPDAIRKFNNIYRKKDHVTDILSFPEDNDDPGSDDGFLGEIIINFQEIKKQAKYYSGTVDEELVFILSHGLLHLLGYGDETNRGKSLMDRKVRDFLKKKKGDIF